MWIDNRVGEIPSFTNDEGSPEGAAEAATVVDQTDEQIETEEQEVAPEGEETTGGTPPQQGEPAATLTPEEVKELEGLRHEKEKLLDEIRSLRGDRRELKQEQINKVDDKIDALKDLNPQDVEIIDKVLKSKGYVTREESQRMQAENAKQSALNAFLEKYPEYKPENDPNDLNWNSLQRELKDYNLPSDQGGVGRILEKAHKAISKPASPTDTTTQKHRVAVAGHGSGGVQKSSTDNTQASLTEAQKAHLLEGGWTEEEIKNMSK